MEDVENELTCSICLEYFEHPLMLPCSHNFCKKCIQGIVRAKHGVVSKSFDCPTCRFTINLDPVKGLDGLTFNRALENLARISKTENENADKLEKLISTWKSDTKLFSGLLNLECGDHGANSSKFCKGCGKVLCNDCDVISHSDKCRNPILPVTTLLELESKLYDTLLRLNQNKKAITEKVTLLQDILKQVDEYESKLISQVDEECDWLINSIKSKKEELKKQLHESVQGVRQPVEKTLGQYQALLDKVANQTKWLNDITAPNKSLQTKLLHLESTEKQLSRLLGFEIIPLAHEPIPDISVPKITLDSQINKLETEVRHVDWQPQDAGTGENTIQTFYPSANSLTGSRNINLSKEQSKPNKVSVGGSSKYASPHQSTAHNVKLSSTEVLGTHMREPTAVPSTVSSVHCPPTSVQQRQDGHPNFNQRNISVSLPQSSASFTFTGQSGLHSGESRTTQPQISVPVSVYKDNSLLDQHSQVDQGHPNFKTQFSFRNSFPSASSPEIRNDETMPSLPPFNTSNLTKANLSFSTSCPNIEKIKTIPKVGTNMLSRTTEASEPSSSSFVSSTYAFPKQLTAESSSIPQSKTLMSMESKPALLQRAASHSAIATTPSTLSTTNTFSSISFDVGKRRNSVTSVATLSTPDGRFVNALCSPRIGRRNSTFSIYVKRDGDVNDIIVSPTSDSNVDPLRSTIQPNPSLYTVQTIQPTVFTLSSDNNKKKAQTNTTSSGMTKQVSSSVIDKQVSSNATPSPSIFSKPRISIDKQISVDGAQGPIIDASYGGFCPAISFTQRSFPSCKHHHSYKAKSTEQLDQLVNDRTTQINFLKLDTDKYRTHGGVIDPDSSRNAQEENPVTSVPMDTGESVSLPTGNSFSSTHVNSSTATSSSTFSFPESSQQSMSNSSNIPQVFSMRDFLQSSPFLFSSKPPTNTSFCQPRMIHRSNSTESYLLRNDSRSGTPPPQSFTTVSPVFVIGTSDNKNSSKFDKSSGSRKPKFLSRSNSEKVDNTD